MRAAFSLRRGGADKTGIAFGRGMVGSTRVGRWGRAKVVRMDQALEP